MFENCTRFEWGVEVGVVTIFMLRLFVSREFDMMINYRAINEKLSREKWKLLRSHEMGCRASCFRGRQWLPQLRRYDLRPLFFFREKDH